MKKNIIIFVLFILGISFFTSPVVLSQNTKEKIINEARLKIVCRTTEYLWRQDGYGNENDVFPSNIYNDSLKISEFIDKQFSQPGDKTFLNKILKKGVYKNIYDFTINIFNKIEGDGMTLQQYVNTIDTALVTNKVNRRNLETYRALRTGFSIILKSASEKIEKLEKNKVSELSEVKITMIEIELSKTEIKFVNDTVITINVTIKKGEGKWGVTDYDKDMISILEDYKNNQIKITRKSFNKEQKTSFKVCPINPDSNANDNLCQECKITIVPKPTNTTRIDSNDPPSEVETENTSEVLLDTEAELEGNPQLKTSKEDSIIILKYSRVKEIFVNDSVDSKDMSKKLNEAYKILNYDIEKNNESEAEKLKDESSEDKWLQNLNLYYKYITFGLTFLVVILLSLIFYVFWKAKKIDKAQEVRIDKAKSDNKQVLEENKDIKFQLDQLENRNSVLDAENITLRAEVQKLKFPVTATQPSIQKVEPPPPDSVKYALFPDSPEGFNISRLSDNEGRGTIYKIKIIGDNQAVFRISTNPSIQKKALDNTSRLLEAACEYVNSPNDGNSIETQSEGSLLKSGNVWKIIKKAKIKFV